jgi:hypothetical protein
VKGLKVLLDQSSAETDSSNRPQAMFFLWQILGPSAMAGESSHGLVFRGGVPSVELYECQFFVSVDEVFLSTVVNLSRVHTLIDATYVNKLQIERLLRSVFT